MAEIWFYANETYFAALLQDFACHSVHDTKKASWWHASLAISWRFYQRYYISFHDYLSGARLKMEKASKFIVEVFPGMKEALGLEVYKSHSMSTNMPSDNIGFWITQGLPFGLFILHILSTIIGDVFIPLISHLPSCLNFLHHSF